MPPYDGLTAVARELAVLPASDRRAVLQAFDDADRARLQAALRNGPAIASAPLTADPRHSPWVEGLIAAAGDEGGDERMTGAVRSALLDAVGRPRGSATRQSGRSLLQAAGGLLGQAIAR